MHAIIRPTETGPDSAWARDHPVMGQEMRSRTLAAVAALGVSLPAAAGAVNETQFQVKTEGDLVALCSTPQSDPLAAAALNFCEGFAVGAYQYHQIAEAASKAKPLFCPPSPPPSRNQTIAAFVEWSNQHPATLNGSPIEGIFAFLSDRYPCR